MRADDGTLTIGGAINEVTTIGTADNDGTLNVVNAWNSNVALNVVLNGGVLQGGAITVANANGIKGRGLVSSRVVNNTSARGQRGGEYARVRNGGQRQRLGRSGEYRHSGGQQAAARSK